MADTQLQRARDGEITEEMLYVAAREGMDPEYARSKVGTNISLNQSQ